MKVFIVIDSGGAVATVVGLYTCATDAHLHWKRLPAASIWQGLLNYGEMMALFGLTGRKRACTVTYGRPVFHGRVEESVFLHKVL